MRVALVHDWLTGMRGGEKVLEALCELYPDADLFTLLHVPGSVSPVIERHRPRTSFVQWLPGATRRYRGYLPLFPIAVEQFDLDDYDLVVSTSHCAAKSVVPTGRARHLCYCHSPMRYAWDQFDAYFGPARLGVLSRAARRVMAAMARWDARTSGRVHRYVANSQYVAERIARYYNRRSAVVYPPVDTEFFQPTGPGPGAGFLVVSALVPYKRLEVAIDACRLVGAPLRIVGTGPELARLQQVSGPDVAFLGAQTDEELRRLYGEARAVLLPGEEDFGIVPVEAQSCGRPVVALGRGGALETVVDGKTGVLVPEATPEAFADGLRRVARLGTDPRTIRAHALRFGRDRFAREMAAAVEDLMTAATEAVRC
jgi:glycosyltransferase involved in cell wall biosynthesis